MDRVPGSLRVLIATPLQTPFVAMFSPELAAPAGSLGSVQPRFVFPPPSLPGSSNFCTSLAKGYCEMGSLCPLPHTPFRPVFFPLRITTGNPSSNNIASAVLVIRGKGSPAVLGRFSVEEQHFICSPFLRGT